ncbi:uncharacterized protein G2W53_008384 [Senna tora]|uniref:Uncharacterized protein n=1 Tax=Senna tora TaxID=362788 RepID=A0A834X8L5_9FABA|nr:uncharacterized protein G2W53_008384 [Senna tora]
MTKVGTFGLAEENQILGSSVRGKFLSSNGMSKSSEVVVLSPGLLMNRIGSDEGVRLDSRVVAIKEMVVGHEAERQGMDMMIELVSEREFVDLQSVLVGPNGNLVEIPVPAYALSWYSLEVEEGVLQELPTKVVTWSDGVSFVIYGYTAYNACVVPPFSFFITSVLNKLYLTDSFLLGYECMEIGHLLGSSATRLEFGVILFFGGLFPSLSNLKPKQSEPLAFIFYRQLETPPIQFGDDYNTRRIVRAFASSLGRLCHGKTMLAQLVHESKELRLEVTWL